ncbi:MAG: ferritin [Tannerellaceae bacterium]|nr:ferritin [Tannerellaceae bacterium]
MILSRKLSNALNDLIIAEMWSSNLYMSMAVHFTILGMNKCAAWMREKQLEELEHAYQVMEYSVRNGGEVVIGVINSVPTGYGTPKEVLEHALKHEEHQVGLIKKMTELAVAENDKMTEEFLNNFAHSQMSTSAKSVMEKLKDCGAESLETIDHQLHEK